MSELKWVGAQQSTLCESQMRRNSSDGLFVGKCFLLQHSAPPPYLCKGSTTRGRVLIAGVDLCKCRRHGTDV